MESAPEEILKRLEELRCWLDMQQQKLLSKQLSRSQLCSMEQMKLCEIFGLSITSTVSNLSLSDSNEQRPLTSIKSSNDVAIITKRNASVTDDKSDMDTNSVPGTPQKHFRVETPINNFSLEELESYGKENMDQMDSHIDDKPKRSFLKRGQGLAARFKIHPEKLRIENLPKYKFANSHKKSRFFREKQNCESKRSDVPKAEQFDGGSKFTNKNPVKREVVGVSKQRNKFNDDGQPRALKLGKFRCCAGFPLDSINFPSKLQINDHILTQNHRHQQHGLMFCKGNNKMLLLKSKPRPSTMSSIHQPWLKRCKNSTKIIVISKSLSYWNKT